MMRPERVLLAVLWIAIFICIALTVVAVHEAYPQAYQVTVTRKDTNLYKIEFSSYWIITRYCFELAYYDDAILDDSRMKLVFLDSGEVCEVVRVVSE